MSGSNSNAGTPAGKSMAADSSPGMHHHGADACTPVTQGTTRCRVSDAQTRARQKTGVRCDDRQDELLTRSTRGSTRAAG